VAAGRELIATCSSAATCHKKTIAEGIRSSANIRRPSSTAYIVQAPGNVWTSSTVKASSSFASLSANIHSKYFKGNNRYLGFDLPTGSPSGLGIVAHTESVNGTSTIQSYRN
jgi:uncharacterized protein YaiE (UPF0345 family)